MTVKNVSSGAAVAVVGASTLRGKELKSALEERQFPVRRLTLLDDEDRRGLLTEFAGEPAILRPVERDSFTDVDFVLFAGSAAYSRNVWPAAKRAGCRGIDLTGAFDRPANGEPGGRVAAPLATEALPAGESLVFVAAHPAAIVIQSVLSRAAGCFPLSRAIVDVFEPASERGSEGVDELHQQTISLLSFHDPPRRVFDAQVAFNLAPALGEESRPALLEAEERIARHVAAISAAIGAAVEPSVRLAQAGTFHSHSFSFYLEAADAARRDIARLTAAFGADGFDLRGEGVEPPSAVSAANNPDILVGDIRPDRANARGIWLWAAADNLRLLAHNAVRIAELAR